MKTFCLCSIIALSLLHAEETMQSWTDAQGRVIKAKFVNAQLVGGAVQVKLMLDTGKVATVPLLKLSEQSKSEVMKRGVTTENKTPEAKPTEKWVSDRVTFDDKFEVLIMQEDDEKHSYIYETPNYRFSSDAKLTKSLVKDISYDFETTRKALVSLPLGVSGKSKKNDKLSVKLFEKRSSFVDAGGSPDAASTYKGDLDFVFLPFNGIGVTQIGSSYTVDRSKSENFRHTLVLQLLPDEYWGQDLPNQWLIHGIAGYIASLKMKNNSIYFSDDGDDVISFITKYGYNGKNGKNLGNVISIPKLETYMSLSNPEFWANHKTNYGAAALIFYYFAKIDGKGDGANLIKYLQALKNGVDSVEAKKILFAGKSYDEVEKEIFKAYDKRHITIIFAH